MNLKNIVVRDYLESLTEKNELNRIFPILLESLGFNILTKPTEYIGLQEYGKDIVAVGRDSDGIKKRFYFELKGGSDRNITESNFYSKDGINNSLIQSTYNKFISAFPEFDSLPLKIIIVHNGVISGNVQSTFESLIKNLEKNSENISYDRWDIHRLTLLFSEHLFSCHLLTSEESTKLFNKVLINLDANSKVSYEYHKLIDLILPIEGWSPYKSKIPRKWTLSFESLKLISYIIYTEADHHNNLSIAKRHLSVLVLKFWYWVLKNELESDKKILNYFDSIFSFYNYLISRIIERNLNIALSETGLFFEKAGRYEQIGYTLRSFDFLDSLNHLVKYDLIISKGEEIDKDKLVQIYLGFLNQNDVATRPLIDIHSITIIDTIEVLIKLEAFEVAESYLENIISHIEFAKESSNRLLDGSNIVQNIIRKTVTGQKSVYYIDETSSLLAILMEFTLILNKSNLFQRLLEYVVKNNIDLGVFIPHHGVNSLSKDLIENLEDDLEEQIVSRSVNDGYQSEVSIKNTQDNSVLNYESFKNKFNNRFEEFQYNYRTTDKYRLVLDLGHQIYKTPYFPDKWRKQLNY